MKNLTSVAVSLALSTALLFALPANVNAAKIKKIIGDTHFVAGNLVPFAW
ncbi:hypothetical protein [Lentilactobacillus rapi]|nr:hypothetical protein [Lentilactobacillus rapi]